MSTSERKTKNNKGETGIFDTYLIRVLKMVHSEVGVTREALTEMNELVLITARRIIDVISQLNAAIGSETVGHREVESALRIVLTDDLCDHAVSAGDVALTKFRSSSTDESNTAKYRNARAGIQFSIPRAEKLIRDCVSGVSRVSSGAPVFLAAVLEYLSAEILTLAGTNTLETKHKRITPRNILFAIGTDPELSKLYRNVVMPGGELPSIMPRLLPNSHVEEDDEPMVVLPPSKVEKVASSKKKPLVAPSKKAHLPQKKEVEKAPLKKHVQKVPSKKVLSKKAK